MRKKSSRNRQLRTASYYFPAPKRIQSIIFPEPKAPKCHLPNPLHRPTRLKLSSPPNSPASSYIKLPQPQPRPLIQKQTAHIKKDRLPNSRQPIREPTSLNPSPPSPKEEDALIDFETRRKGRRWLVHVRVGERRTGSCRRCAIFGMIGFVAVVW